MRKIIIKLLLIILICCSLIFSSGCWDYREYENLALISALGFDVTGTDNKVTATVLYLVPGGGSTQTSGSGSKSSTGFAVVKATGLSTDDALAKIQQATGKRLFYGYMDEIILGYNAARLITSDIIGYIDRTPNIRTASYIAVTPGKAEDVLSTVDSNVTESPGKNIHNLIDQSLNTGSAYPVRILDFEQKLAFMGGEPVAPVVTVNKTESSNTDSKSSETSSDNASDSSKKLFESSGNSTEQGAVELGKPQNGFIKVDKIAVFNVDKLAGYMTGKACTGLCWITNQNVNPYEVVKTSEDPKVANTIIYRVTKNKCKINVRIENDKPVVDIDLYVEADLRKISKNYESESLTPDVIDDLNNRLADNLHQDISEALEQGQKALKADVFGIGSNFYRQHPQLWHSEYEKNWNQIFPNIKININTSAKVIDTGTSVKKLAPK